MESWYPSDTYHNRKGVVMETLSGHILIVEDDYELAEALRDLLHQAGCIVSHTDSFSSTLNELKNTILDLIILDVHLNAENGYELCRKIRELSDIPILFLTGCSSETELLEGFHSGGDDYLTKPFRMRELLVRIQALLRRTARELPVITSGNLSCDRRSQQFFVHDMPLELTLTEYRLASCLLTHYPGTVSRDQLFYEVWDQYNAYVDSNTLNVNMSRLREKLGVFETTPYIMTVRGLGYRWAIPVNRSLRHTERGFL